MPIALHVCDLDRVKLGWAFHRHSGNHIQKVSDVEAQPSQNCTQAPASFHIISGTSSSGMCCWQTEQNGAIDESGLLQTSR